MARTPSAAAHEKVIEAAIQLIAERGIDGASMDAIAQVSGVSKATVYKHWKDKEALVIDVIGSAHQQPPEVHSGDTYRDLVDYLTWLSKKGRPDKLTKIWPKVIGHAVTNRRFAAALQEHSFQPRRARIARILKDAADRGDLPGDIDPDFATDLLIGPIMHRRFAASSVPDGFAEKVVEAFLRSHAKAKPLQTMACSTRHITPDL